MPMAIVGIAAAAIGPALAGSLGIMSGLLTSLVGGIISMGINMLGSAIFGEKPKGPSFDNALQDRTSMLRQPITTQKIIYGNVRLSGPWVFYDKTVSAGQTYHHIVIALAGHECESIERMYFDNRLAWVTVGGQYQSWLNDTVRLKPHLGGADQVADSDLAAESPNWTVNHRGRGICYAYIRIKRDLNVFPNGFPNISFLMRGKKVFDPRASTTAYSVNPALCIRDYLTDTKFGLKCDSDEIDDDNSFEPVANVCDEDVNLAAGGTENRYELHGTIDSSNTPREIIENMLTALGGRLVYSSGVFSLADVSYQTPEAEIDEDSLRGAISLQTEISNRDIFNAVKGKFSSAADKYILTDYPSIVSSAYAEADGGITVYKELTLPFTTSPSMAQRLAKIYLLKSRLERTIVAPCNLSALRLKAGDNALFTFAALGFDQLPVNVREWSFAVDEKGRPGIDLVLRETASEAYDWETSEEIDFLAGSETNLPDPLTVATPGITLSDTTRLVNETVFSVLIIDVTSGDDTVDTFEAQARRYGDSDWVNAARASGNRFEVLNVSDGQAYEVRARAMNSLGVKSAWTDPVATRTIVGKLAAPATVTNYSINIIDGLGHHSWDPVADGDLSHYFIRWSPLTSGATLSESITIVDKVPRPTTHFAAPALTGTYFIKAVDTSGNESAAAASVVTIFESVKNLNVVETVTEDPGFTGTKTDTEVVSSKLQLVAGGVSFGDLAGSTFGDLAGTTFGDYVSAFVEEGSYETDYVDFSERYTFRATIDIEVERFDSATAIDALTDNIDDWPDFDGDPDNFNDTNVELYIALTDDDPAGTPTWSSWRRFLVGEYTGRACKFKAVLKTSNVAATPVIAGLTITLDMPDRLYSDGDIASGTDAGGLAVTFDPDFKVLKGLAIVAQNLATGDFYEILAKDETGFTIRFKNSGGTVVSRTFDYTAAGYGHLAA